MAEETDVVEPEALETPEEPEEPTGAEPVQPAAAQPQATPAAVSTLTSDQTDIAKLAADQIRKSPTWQQGQTSKLATDAADIVRAQHRDLWSTLTKTPITAGKGFREALDNQAIGFVRDLAYSVDPSLKWSERTDSELGTLKSSNQAEIDRLNREIDGNTSDEFTYTQDLSRIASLTNDNQMIDAQLQARATGTQPNTISNWQRVAGHALQQYADFSAQATKDRIAAMPTDPFFEASTQGAIAKWLGSQAGAATPMLFGGVPALGGMVGGAFEQTYQDARAKGLPLEQAVDLGNAASAFAPAQFAAYETVLGRILAGAGGQTAGEVLKNLIRNVPVGAVTGFAQQLYDNAIYRLGGIDRDRPWTQGLLESTISGAAGMAILGLVGDVPSLAMRSTWKARIDPDRPPGTPEAVSTGEPPTTPEGEPAAIPGAPRPTVAAEAPAPLDLPNRVASDPQYRAQQATELEQGLLGMEEPMARRAPEGAPLEPTGEPEEQAPLGRGGIREVLQDLVDRVGSRANFILSTANELPLRYRRALEEQGIDYRNFTSFWDKDSREFVVNPNTVNTEQALHEVVLRNFMKNAFSDKANVVPLDSFGANAQIPAIAREIAGSPDNPAGNPNIDTNTFGLFDPQSKAVYLNVGKHLASPDPIGQAIRTVSHEIAEHQGTRDQFAPDYIGYDKFLQRVYNTLRESGLGDAIAARFGTTMDGIAKNRGWGTVNEDGTVTYSRRERARLADELLAHHAENYDPHDLDKLPGVFQKMVHFVRSGYERFQGIKMSNYDAFRLIQDSWKSATPPRDPEAQNALIAKRIQKAHENAQSSPRGPTDELDEAARRASPVRQGLSPSRGDANSPEEIRASSERLGALAQSTGRVLTQRELSQSAPNRIIGSDHDIRLPADPANNRAIWVTRPDGTSGVYGAAPSYPSPTGQRTAPEGAGTVQPRSPYAANQATGGQYLRRLELANQYLGTDHQLVGFIPDPASGTWRVASSQPRIAGDFRKAETGEIASWMAARGFHQIDESTYYNPEARVIVLQADGNHVWIEGDNGNVHAANTAPFEVTGELAAHLDSIVKEPTRTAGLEDPEGITNQLKARGLAEPETTPQAQARFERGLVHDEAELTDLRQKEAAGMITPAEQLRLDDLDMGPLLARDLEAELAPGSPDEPPTNLLRRAIEDYYRGNPPDQAERARVQRLLTDPTEPDTIKAANYADSQRLYNKATATTREETWNRTVNNYNGDTDAIRRDLLSGKLFSEVSDLDEGLAMQVIAYGKLRDEAMQQRQESARLRDPGETFAAESRRISLDAWANRVSTQTGKALQAFSAILHGGQNTMDRINAEYYNMVRQRLEKDVGQRQDIEKIRKANQQATDTALAHPDVKQAIETAENAIKKQRARTKAPAKEAEPEEPISAAMERAKEITATGTWRNVIDQYVDALGRQISSAVSRTGRTPEERAALQEMFNRFQTTIGQRFKEESALPSAAAQARMSTSKTVGEAIRNWDVYSRAWQEAINQAREKNPDMTLLLSNLQRDLATPLSERQGQALLREKGVDLAELIRQHRNARANLSQSLTDSLMNELTYPATGPITPEEAERVGKISKLVGDKLSKIVNSVVQEKIAKQFDAIVERSRTRGGRPPSQQAQAQAKARLLDLVHMGAFGDEQVADALGPLYGYKGYQPEMQEKLGALADSLDAIQSKGTQYLGTQTEMIKRQLYREMANYSKENALTYFNNVFQGNLISGLGGHLIGLFHQMFQLASRFPVDAGPRGMFRFASQLPYIYFQRAIPQTLETFRTGLAPLSLAHRAELASRQLAGYYPSYLETSPGERLARQIPTWAGGRALEPLNHYVTDPFYTGISRYIAAFHTLNKEAGSQGMKWILSRRLALEQGLSPEEALNRADEALRGTDAIIQQAREQAENEEGLTGNAAKVRTNQIIDQNLPEPIRELADYFGYDTVLMNRPMGITGWFANEVSRMARQSPWIKTVVPIVRVPANLMNLMVEYSPLGYAVRFAPGAAEKWATAGGAYKLLTDDEAAQYREAGQPIPDNMISPERYGMLKENMLARAHLGTAALLGLWAASRLGGILIHGAGPSDKNKANQLRDNGWQPYSIQIGNSYFPYEWAPFWAGLAAIGNYDDAFRYPKPNEMPEPGMALQRSISLIPSAFFDRSFVRGIKDFMDAVSGANERADKGWLEYTSRQAGKAVPIAGATLFRNTYQQFIDDTLYQAKGWSAFVRDIPFMAPATGAKPVLNALGQPVDMEGGLFTHRFWSAAREDPVWDFLNTHNLWIGKPTSPLLEGRMMDEDQRYNFVALRGQRLREIVTANLDELNSLASDPEALRKRWRILERQSTGMAKTDMLEGRKPTFEPSRAVVPSMLGFQK
jgi:hypothetical protein